MSEHLQVLESVHHIVCVSCGVDVQSRLLFEGEQWSGAAAHGRDRLAEGWQLWVSRSRRWYCPEHKPARGHRMDRIMYL